MVDTFFLRALSGMNCDAILAAPLSRFTTFHIGGPADVLIKPHNTAALAQILRLCRETQTPRVIIGKGSNLLVSDRGFAGAVICLDNQYGEIRLLENGLVECDAGVTLMRLCHFALEHSLSGLEFAYGIPGSVGGAVYMNAGAYGGEIKDIIVSACHLDQVGEKHTLLKDQLALSYRHSIYAEGEDCIISACFALTPSNQEEIRSRMDDYMRRRKEKQPLEYPSAGSTFKRPQGAYAAQLIDECGLRGFTVGGAQVSEKHAGFVINTGNATCEDVLELTRQVSEKVKKEKGYELQLEVRLLP